MLLSTRDFHENRRREFCYKSKWNYIDACPMKPYDISKAKATCWRLYTTWQINHFQYSYINKLGRRTFKFLLIFMFWKSKPEISEIQPFGRGQLREIKELTSKEASLIKDSEYPDSLLSIPTSACKSAQPRQVSLGLLI